MEPCVSQALWEVEACVGHVSGGEPALSRCSGCAGVQVLLWQKDGAEVTIRAASVDCTSSRKAHGGRQLVQQSSIPEHCPLGDQECMTPTLGVGDGT